MIERKDKRTLNSKVFDKEDGEFVLQAHAGHIHYNNKLAKGDGVTGLRSIDTTLQWDESRRGWYFEFHNFNPFLPEYADGWADFVDLYENKNQSISYKPRCSRVKGRLVESIEGVTDMNAVIYDDAFGEGFDLIYYFTRSQMLKVVRIRESFKPKNDIFFDFHVKLSDPTMKVLRSYDDGDEYELDITRPKTFDSARKTKLKKRNKENGETNTYLRTFKAWDSGDQFGIQIIEVIEVDLMMDEEGVFFRKNITADFLARSNGDVFTDTTTSYYAGSGDGGILAYQTESTPSQALWDELHDWDGTAAGVSVLTSHTDATLLGDTYTVRTVRSNTPNGLQIGRVFLPFDTSAIGAGSTITAATLSIYAATSASGITIGVVQATQASTSSLSNTDFDQCGAINSPTEGASRVTPTTTAQRYNFTLNATGQGFINKTGVTKLGLRSSEDMDDAYPSATVDKRLQITYSEYSGTTNDPYLEVTFTEGGGGGGQNSNFLALM